LLAVTFITSKTTFQQLKNQIQYLNLINLNNFILPQFELYAFHKIPMPGHPKDLHLVSNDWLILCYVGQAVTKTIKQLI
jgi:hypothetical protein